MKKRLLILGLIFTAIASFGLWSISQNTSYQASENVVLGIQNIVEINNKSFKVEMVENDELKAKGLSGRSQLDPDQGMLFVFDPAIQPSFWMKDMLFDIDIIWIKDKKIIAITRNAPTPKTGVTLSDLPKYEPPSEVDYVLEVSSGMAGSFNVGDAILIGQTQSL